VTSHPTNCESAKWKKLVDLWKTGDKDDVNADTLFKRYNNGRNGRDRYPTFSNVRNCVMNNADA
jgi:hypothetical protein